MLSLNGAITDFNASKAAQFTEFTLNGGGLSAITKVADTQTVNATANAKASAAGYVPNGGLDANDETVAKTTYAGTLNLTAKSATAITALSANASELKLAISNATSTLNGVTTATAGTAVTLVGDVKTATITIGSSVDNSKLPTTDLFSSVSVTPANTGAGVGTPFTNLGSLTSLTLTGTGSATVVNNSGSSKLATIDASGLAGKTTIAGSTVGTATTGLAFTAGTLLETVKLGSAIDTLTFAATTSIYSKMDSITGYSAVADAAGDRVASKSDNISGIAGVYVAKTTGVSGSLDAALTAAGNHKVSGTDSELVVFQNGGNTYIYRDIGTNGLDDDDLVIELVGLVDLTLLIADLAA